MDLFEDYVYLKPDVKLVAVRPYMWMKQVSREMKFPAVKTFSDLLENELKYPFNAPAHRTCADAYFRSELNTVLSSIVEKIKSMKENQS